MSKNTLEKINLLKSKIERLLEHIVELRGQNQDTRPTMRRIWELSKKKFVLQTEANEHLKPYDGIIFTVGTTAEPIILNILANKPKAVFFIHTDRSESYIDTITDETSLKTTQSKRGKMPKNSIIALFRLVKEGLSFLNEEKGIDKQKIAIDPTGGTKVMSAGCGLATSLLDLDLLYVDNEKYNVALRRPEPGSEKLVNFPNPKNILLNDKLLEDIEVSKSTIAQISEYVQEITSTHVIYLSFKLSGELLSEISFLKDHQLDADIFSGLITAFDGVGREVSKDLLLKLDKKGENEPQFQIDYKGFKMNVIDGEFARIIVISDRGIGDLFKKKIFQLIDEYESIHFNELKNFKSKIDVFNDFPQKAMQTLDVGLNEECVINKDKIYQYKKNPTIMYVINDWYEKMRATTSLDSFYPVMIPNVLKRELGIDEDEARYWTYDLFKENMIIPKD